MDYDYRISTIPETLTELEKHTGRAWTDSELFDVVTRYGIELHAAAPITAQTTIQKFVVGKGMVENFKFPSDHDWLLEPHIVPNSHSGLAVLFPKQVNQLRISGETLTSYPSDHNEIEGEYKLFTAPVRVTREQVRIKGATLKKILTIWDKEQAEQTAAKGKAGAGTTPGDDWKEKAHVADDPDHDHDETLAALFDPLPVEALAKMFMIDLAQWKKWQDKAKANGLIDARQGTALFNPYKAGVWLVRKGTQGWDDAHLYRVLAKNLPARSRDEAHLLTGGID